tara:strand:- start:20065 stop:20991 length:927 start_codon:yes stop_codon:yes gene_type:complete
MKKLFFIYFFFFNIFFYSNIYASTENKIIVKINDKIISSYEIKNKINTELVLRNLEINQKNIDNFKNFSLQELIKLRLKEIEILKFMSTNYKNVDISKQLNKISSGNTVELKKRFENNKINYDIFISELKIQTAWQQLIFRLFKNKVQIDENEIIKLANEFKNTRQFKEFDLSEIVITFENNNDIKAKIENVKNSLNDVGFEKTVKIFSESDTATNNGKLGLISENMLSTEISQKLRNLREGEISEPITQSNKILFLKINKINKTKNNNLDFEKLKKNIENKKKNDLLNLYSESHLSKLKNSTYIEFK